MRPVTKREPAIPAAEQLAAFAEAFRVNMTPVFRQIAEQMQAMHAALKPLIDHYEQHPELFAQLQPAAESCHCLCGRHPAQPGVCTQEAEPGLTIAFTSPQFGLTHVRVCRNCHDAHTGSPLRPRRPDMGELEAVTDTCTCHCWQNHPEVTGVCEAASQAGSTIHGRPCVLRVLEDGTERLSGA